LEVLFFLAEEAVAFFAGPRICASTELAFKKAITFQVFLLEPSPVIGSNLQ